MSNIITTILQFVSGLLPMVDWSTILPANLLAYAQTIAAAVASLIKEVLASTAATPATATAA